MVGFSCKSQAKEELTVAVFPSATTESNENQKTGQAQTQQAEKRDCLYFVVIAKLSKSIFLSRCQLRTLNIVISTDHRS